MSVRMDKMQTMGLDEEAKPRERAGDAGWGERVIEALEGLPSQTLLMLCLLVALYAPDVAAITSADKSVMDALEVVLLCIFVLFALEWVANCLFRPHFKWGFFFWMDLVGTLSIVLDISWMAQGLGLDGGDEGTQKASRAARVGGRGGRFTRILRVVKLLFQVVLNPQEFDTTTLASSGGAPTLIGQTLMQAVTWRVTVLLLLTVLVVPNLVPDQDNWLVMDAYAKVLAEEYGQLPADPPPTADQVRSHLEWLVLEYHTFFEEHSKTGYEPVELYVNNVPLHDKGTWGEYNNHPADKLVLEDFTVKMGYNVAEANHEKALFNILFITFVLCVMVGFSAVLNLKTTELVVRPLERIFKVIQEHASHVMGKLDMDLNQQEVDRTVSKMKLLMRNLRNKSSKDTVETMLESHGGKVDAETKAWLIGTYTETLSSPTESGSRKAMRPSLTLVQARRIAGRASGESARLRVSMDVTRTSAGLDFLAAPDFEGLLALLTEDERRTEVPRLLRISAATVNTWHFDAFSMSRPQLFLCVYWIFDGMGLVDGELVSMDTFWNFLHTVASTYNDVPYHNFFHCIDVTQTLYRMMTLVDNRMKFTPIEKFSMLVGALAHDLDHPGVSNAFLVATRNQLAVTYNDSSVLENHHAAGLYKLTTTKPECNIFKVLEDSPATWKEARKTIVSMILHTDMIHHFKMVSELELFIELHAEELQLEVPASDEPPPELTEWLKTEERTSLINLLMHLADISNPVKPFAVYEKWAACVLNEFFQQGDMERGKGMPISPMMDRDTTSMPLSQINFIEFVVTPLYLQAYRLFPELNELLRNLLDNRRRYGELYLDEVSDDKVEEEARARLVKYEDKLRSAKVGADESVVMPTTVPGQSTRSSQWRRRSIMEGLSAAATSSASLFSSTSAQSSARDISPLPTLKRGAVV